MEQKRYSRKIDLGIAAIYFACFLEIFGLGSNQTPSTIQAANLFALAIPMIVGSTIMAVFFSDFSLHHQWLSKISWVMDVINALGNLIGFFGIYYMFASVSDSGAKYFIVSSLIFLGVGVIWMKILIFFPKKTS